jgi:hypothetical protein
MTLQEFQGGLGYTLENTTFDNVCGLETEKEDTVAPTAAPTIEVCEVALQGELTSRLLVAVNIGHGEGGGLSFLGIICHGRKLLVYALLWWNPVILNKECCCVEYDGSVASCNKISARILSVSDNNISMMNIDFLTMDILV